MAFIDQYSFSQKWKSWKNYKYANEPREINPKFVRDLPDFKRYFDTFIEFNRNQKISVIGMVNLNGINPFLIKISML